MKELTKEPKWDNRKTASLEIYQQLMTPYF